MLQKFPTSHAKDYQASKRTSTYASPAYYNKLSYAAHFPWRASLPYSCCPSPALREWLLGRNSLTAKLVALSHGNFRVEVLSQRLGKAQGHEINALNIARHEICLLREVVLWGEDQPWVFARSVLPLSSLTGRLRHLRKQGARPLGAYLFQQADLQRSPIEIARFDAQQNYVPQAYIAKDAANDSPLWGRRSIFYLDQKPLLVSEVFLSGFPAVKLTAQSHGLVD